MKNSLDRFNKRYEQISKLKNRSHFILKPSYVIKAYSLRPHPSGHCSSTLSMPVARLVLNLVYDSAELVTLYKYYTNFCL